MRFGLISIFIFIHSFLPSLLFSNIFTSRDQRSSEFNYKITNIRTFSIETGNDLLYYRGNNISLNFFLISNLSLNPALNFEQSFTFNTKSGLDTAGLTYHFQPIRFIRLSHSYVFKFYSQYRVAEHNFVNLLHLQVTHNKFVHFFHSVGFSLQIVDFDTTNFSSTYKNDWYFYFITLVDFTLRINPVKYYSIEFSLTNYDKNQIYSFNYVEFRIKNFFRLNSSTMIYFTISAGYTGSLPFAGILSVVKGTIGVKYALH